MADSSFPISGRPSLLRTAALNNSLGPHNLSHSFLLQEQTQASIMEDTAMIEDTMDDEDRGRSRTDVLFPQFFDMLQTHGGGPEIFEVLQGLAQICRGVVETLELEIDRGVGGAQGARQREATLRWLRQEINTWLLLHALFHDRVLVQSDTRADDEMQDGPTLGGSEKEVIQQLYAINATLREYQLVVDWLEACYKPDEQVNLLHCHDRMMSWENTLFQLENLQGAAFGRGHEIVSRLDPDASVRQKRPLHALDEEDNHRLSRAIFSAIRSGQVDDGLKLCKHYGQTWRAAILEGWRLHEDPNFEQGNPKMDEKMPIEGNPRRDVWKRCAWLLADSKNYDEYSRATAGVFSGHLASLKSLLHNDWHDLLWAYLKVQIDIRVESEIRECCVKRYQPMPDEYWNGKMTMEQIFDELNVAKDASVRDYAQGQLGIIQRHLILDTCGELLQHMVRWLDKDAGQLSPHQLRFMAHIVIFLRQIGRLERDSPAEKVIAAYVEALIERGDAQLIAYYTASLSKTLQVQLYSRFLEQVEQKQKRERALEAAMQAGLDVAQITRLTVENIRNTPVQLGELGEPRSGEVSAGDTRKIHALEWLTHLPEQRGELLWQANAMIRTYLGCSKVECVRQAFEVVPGDVVQVLINQYGSMNNLPPREECSLKEYLCYKVYLAGIDSFLEWNSLYHNKPQKPQQDSIASGQDNFTERMANERKEQAHRNKVTRWETRLKEQSKQTMESLFNVLMFPEKGWLVDPFIPKEPENAVQLKWEYRTMQMEKLRSLCLPEIALFLHDVMYKSGDFAGCVRLADEISSESRQLYKVYTKHKLAELMSKIADASLELLNSKLDPWGYPITA
ncbi:uncharacterized protein Dana_GF14071 [Drosophila ananassae]|uniref:Nuclear pore complex protein n=1 Tax=Drosophila ananassae TaxID=7217 RepID=B3MJV2_DROAN|nr:nuclear pore complex protein Nup107 [Drosophila ananassae]EDV32407.1 uncharacterized protein Dana_GF14071 [Drosophila ananassae]